MCVYIIVYILYMYNNMYNSTEKWMLLNCGVGEDS